MPLRLNIHTIRQYDRLEDEGRTAVEERVVKKKKTKIITVSLDDIVSY